MRRSLLVVMLSVPVQGACSTIVGAEFDGLRERSANTAGSDLPRGPSESVPVGGFGNSTSDGGGGATSAGSAGDGGRTNLGGEGGAAGEGRAGAESAGESGSAGSSGTAGSGMGEGKLVINEVKGHGPKEDFIELLNVGTAAINLEGYSVSDEGHTFKFEAVELAPQAYVLLLLGENLMPGQATCFTPNPCFHQTWGVSAQGEVVSLRNPAGELIDVAIFPGESALGPVNNIHTYGRLPNGVGDFSTTASTPEAENRAP